MSHVTSDPFEQPARTVKPRTRKYTPRPVVAIAEGAYLTEDGELGDLEDLIWQLPTMPTTLFLKMAAADWIAELDKIFTPSYKNWQWRATVYERNIVAPGGKIAAQRVSIPIHYFGWSHQAASPRVFHRVIDPIVMHGRKLDEIWPTPKPPILKLRDWGMAIRDFCADNDIEVRPTIGSISAQFLKDSRFYPEPRRKVPAKINERVREYLPGNHYLLNVTPKPSNNFTAYYLDQHRAHHYHAERVALPCANHLFAHGRFIDLAKGEPGLPRNGFHGLFCLDLVAPKKQQPFHWLKSGEKQFVFSNELPHLLDMGYTVKCVRAAWGSRVRDTGIAKYSKWAQAELDKRGGPMWLKQILLATYGVLATCPTFGEAIFKMAKEGQEVTIPTGHHKLSGKYVTRSRKLEPDIVNVIHRGMIEAATRSESVGFAQWLEHLGHRVLSIYADGVIVEADDDKPLPSLPDPWRLQQELNHLQFVNQQAFISDGLTKLPGVGREIREYRQHRKPGHAPHVIDVLGIPTSRRI